LEQAIATGKLDTTKLMAQGVGSRPSCLAHNNCIADATFTVNSGQQKVYKMGVFNTTMVGDDVVWALQHDGCGAGEEYCWLPQYLTNTMQPLPEAAAPADLRRAHFEEKTSTNPPHGPFDATPGPSAARYGMCFDSPGPAQPILYCNKTLGGTWLAWRWYKFVDQPALQRLRLSAEQQAFMQSRVEALHGMAGQKSEWIKPGGASAVGLATLDPVLVMAPPVGLEVGHVPIAVYEGMTKPNGCGGAPPGPAPPTPPVPPPPPPSPTPEYVLADQSYMCPGGFEPIVSATECKAASDMVIKKTWWAIQKENDAADPTGCWVYGPTGDYQYILLNAAQSTSRARTQRSALCKKTAGTASTSIAHEMLVEQLQEDAIERTKSQPI
jgi:hypothetical protein